MCVCMCVMPALPCVLPVWWRAQQDNPVFRGAWHWWGVGVAFGQAAKPWRRGIVPVGGEIKGKYVATANGRSLLWPDLLRDEPLVIST